MNKILVIEDEPAMRKNTVRILQLEGFSVLSAGDGQTGLQMALQEKPDLILCDVMMPRLDGYGVLAALRADPNIRQVPFIFLTARGEKADVRTGMNSGANDYLMKPVDVMDLLASIRARLGLAPSC